MPKSIYIGIPVANLAASTRFYEALGFTLVAQFSDDTTSTMTWSDTITFQLQTHERFKGWVAKDVADTHTSAEVLLTLLQDSRDDVDAMVTTAAKSGGKASAREPIDMGWLYNRLFEDLDGHLFEAVWMDMNASFDAEADSSVN
jgi:hypothetical protein